MPRRLKWTDAMDDAIVAGRAEGRSWDGIAAELGVSRWVTILRGRALGHGHALSTMRPAPVDARERTDALPAGDPISWGAITRGTLLEGSPYEYRMPRVGGKAKRHDGAAENGPARMEDAA